VPVVASITFDIQPNDGRVSAKEITMSIAESFGRSGFAQFVNSPAGRIARVVAGIGFIAWAYPQRGISVGLVLIAVGIIPVVAGAFNLGLISALPGGPINGARIAKRNP
jgi:hypothetical protein